VPSVKGAGGTSGGIGTFFAGAAMVLTGGYLLLTRVSVTSGGWLVYGYNGFGLSLIPLLDVQPSRLRSSAFYLPLFAAVMTMPRSRVSGPPRCCTVTNKRVPLLSK
jgi:hypothetical protein